MQKVLLILKEIRVKQWAKNLLIFFPAYFGTSIFDPNIVLKLFAAFISFCFTVSIVYIINDLKDLPEDKKHQEKKFRPLASGELDTLTAKRVILILLLLDIFILFILQNFLFTFILIVYIFLNLLYSYKLKEFPIWDILLISGLYLLRLYSGSVISKVPISGWLFITVLFGSLLIILGKRYSEFKYNKIKKVLQFYSLDFLKLLLTISSAVSITAYVIYSINLGLLHLPSIVMFVFIIFRYLLLIIISGKGEKPEDLLFSDKQIILMAIFFIIYSGYLIYFK